MRIYWDLTKHCNLKCSHCYNAPQREAAARDAVWERKRELLLQLISKYPEAVIHFLGGEPFVSPDFERAVELCARAAVKVEVTTNGTIHAPWAFKLLTKINHLYVSIDGANERINDELRGIGVFAQSLAFLKAAVGSGVVASISFTVTSKNIQDIDGILALFKESGANSLILSPIKLIGSAKGSEEILGITAQEYFTFVERIAKMSLGENLKIHATGGSARFKDYIKWRFFNDIVDVDPFCGSAQNQLRVSSTGHLLPCASGEVSPYFKRGDWQPPEGQQDFVLPKTLLTTAQQFQLHTSTAPPDVCADCDYRKAKKCYGGCPVKRTYGPAKLCEQILEKVSANSELQWLR
ncbi:radical SAM protein [Neorhizobium sp. T6_25]|uniref:radical SAM protein n=1 Tax=Neorhizobium sp. T6_25 TaxID=2093833 RepID=UPI000CF8A1D1|nr:radical SAM protein [Neorhizobium sp. T6_25]